MKKQTNAIMLIATTVQSVYQQHC